MTNSESQLTRLSSLAGVPVLKPEPASTSAPLSIRLSAPENQNKLDEARSRLAGAYRHKVLDVYQQTFTRGKHELAFLCSEALATPHQVPPCFRFDRWPKIDELSDESKFDLLIHDLQWIREMYPEQWRDAKGGYARLLEDNSWMGVAEYYWPTKHRGETWLMVRQLGLSKEQQWECAFLRSKPIKDAARGLAVRKSTVNKALMERLNDAKRTHRGRYPPEPAFARRFKVWVCGEMTGHSPTATARLYQLWTGQEIIRADAYKDLEWMRLNIPDSRKRRRHTNAN